MEDNYTKEWVVQRRKGNKLILKRLPLEQKIAESYSMFRITYQEFRDILKTGIWDVVDEDEYWSQSTLKNEELKTVFYAVAKNHVTKEMRKEADKRVESTVRGTSCLIRGSDKSYIRIGYRKGRNTTQINRVCIPDYKREEFFQDCKNTDDPLATVHWALRRGYKYFLDWNEYMDKEFERQTTK